MIEIPNSHWSDRTPLECDALAFFSVSRKLWELDTSLFSSKWFDYRSLHPVQATYLYAEEYEKAWARAFSEHYDGIRGPYVKIFRNKDVFSRKGRELTGLWRGRQVADAIGIPYDAYCYLAIKEALLFWNRKHMPQTNQVYSERIVEAIVDEKWPALQETHLHVAKEPEYLVENYANTQAQNDHHEWLFSQLAKRTNADRHYARLIYVDRVLPEAKVEHRLGRDRLLRIQREI